MSICVICPVFLPAASAEQNSFYGIEDDQHIERQALVLYVVQIVLQLLDRIADRRAIWVFDLCPTGQPRCDKMAMVVVRDLGRELLYKVRPFRSRAHKIHFTL